MFVQWTNYVISKRKRDMNKYTAIKLSEHYRDSVRTSGEVIGEFVRDKEVICKLILFIGAKVHLFFIYKTKN
ncbi:hypothetical protein BD847_0663 [Flavobacterium cutihirudinis]|uniref:Uncharacterized protein n=4 Tax=Flavobacterium TaxID=237 RepID=A0A3D9G0I0_9FLAO|nr:hypothetical protein BD847_0663 [Flavobacterium cutihirudinis]